MSYLEIIKSASGDDREELARKIYLSYPTFALIEYKEEQFEILNSISRHFKIPITSVQVSGSAKIGYSLTEKKDREFIPGESDLDIAIIDANLYQKYVEIVFTKTNCYSDRTKFSQPGDAEWYIKCLSQGIFRPDLMPSCNSKKKWRDFFGTLSRKHTQLFKNINAAIYMSETFFEYKQKSLIDDYLKRTEIPGGLL